MKGRKPKPKAALEQSGSWRAKDRADEPEPPPGRPDCPRFLMEKEKTVWKSLIPMLEKMRVLSRIDGIALERYCVNFVRWRDCIEAIRKEGETFTSDSGAVHARPEVAIAAKLDDALRRCEVEFGLTPSSRGRLKANEETTGDPDAHLFPRLKTG